MTNYAGTLALVIDDSASDVDVLCALLARSGVESVVVMDSADVPDALAEIGRPDVIFLDLQMPGMTGYDLLNYFMTLSQLQDVPIVAYTSHLSEMPNCRRAGFHSFLGKPIQGRALPQYMASIFSGQAVWEAP